MERYADVVERLRQAYDGAVSTRAAQVTDEWKVAERAAFLGLLRKEGSSSLLEIGAGTGDHGKFFADAGLDVVCTDLSPAMIEHCRSRGLVAHERDFLHLDLGRAFDVVFAFNCLLHVPVEDLPGVLTSVRGALVPGGLFYLGQYGGIRHVGELHHDEYVPKRFFSWLPDDDLLAVASEAFDVVGFRTVDLGVVDDVHFQSVTLRRPS